VDAANTVAATLGMAQDRLGINMVPPRLTMPATINLPRRTAVS
jgi:hypothetical protein